MELVLTIPWYFFDAGRPELPRVLIQPGRYPVERIANPLGQSAQPWIVLRGTKIGSNAEFIKTMSRSGWGDFSLRLDQSHT